MSSPLFAFRQRLLTQTPLGRLSRRGRDAVRSLGWMGSAQGTGIVVRLGSNLLLTRLLVPEAFALVGTALAVLAMLEWLSDLGLQPAVIRHPAGESERVLSTAWWLGMVRGTVLTSLALLASLPLASFYQQPGLVPVLAIMAIRPLLISLRSPAYPLLRRRMDYRRLFFDEVAQLLVGTAVTLVVAMLWRTPSSIAIGIIAGTITSVGMSYLLIPARPRRPDRRIAGELLRFSGPIFFNTLAMALWLNVDRLLGLKLLPAEQVGLYMIAFNLAAAAEALVVRGCDVYFSALARVSVEERDHWHALQTQRMVRYAMPIGAIAAAASPLAISLLYDSRYHAAGLLLAVLMVRLMIRGFGQMRFQNLLVSAKVGSATIAYVAAFAVQIATIVPLVRAYGLIGLPISALLSTLVVTIVQEVITAWERREELRPLAFTVGWSAAALLGIVLLPL